ncbi:MAG: ATP-binding protein [Tenericutes bacterium]|nr:ATP-binding protein [Mycoplasmatota bacterium]
MFGRILYVSDNTAYIENKVSVNTDVDLLNVHLIFEHNNQKILGEIVEVNSDKIKVHFLGEYVNGEYYNGLLRKASLNSTIRVINAEELTLLLGTPSKDSFVLGKSATYKNYLICPKINSLFANHMCIFGNSGSGKSCGVARVIQNILGNEHSLAYNANFVFFDSFGEYKNAFKSINNINNYYNYKFITSKKKDESDYLINIPINLLTVDDFAILLQADKHSQLTILNRAIKYARLFAQDDLEATRYKNSIIAKALITILYSSDTSKQKKDDIFSIIDICHTKEFNFNTEIKGVGYTRSFSECFSIDSKGRFGEEVLITNYILSYADQKVSYEEKSENCSFSLNDFAKALDFTLISEGFNKNKLMHDDAQLLKVRLNTILNNEMNNYFSGEYTPVENFITSLASVSGKKAQIININLESLDDSYAKSLVKIYSHIIFEFCKGNANRATVPFHLFLEEAHRYIQHDNDVFLLGYNIFDRIAKEGRKYGTILDIISQRPVEISETVVSQCSNFLIFKMTHPKDIKYIEEMLPNISQDVMEKIKVLQPGSCVAFGSAFKIPMICQLEMPSPSPFSASCDVSSYWNSFGNGINS